MMLQSVLLVLQKDRRLGKEERSALHHGFKASMDTITRVNSCVVLVLSVLSGSAFTHMAPNSQIVGLRARSDRAWKHVFVSSLHHQRPAYAGNPISAAHHPAMFQRYALHKSFLTFDFR